MEAKILITILLHQDLAILLDSIFLCIVGFIKSGEVEGNSQRESNKSINSAELSILDFIQRDKIIFFFF